MIAEAQPLSGVRRVAARTPTLPPATHTCSYALGEREVLLVEPATPFEDEAREWIAWAEGLRSEGRRLVGLVATHHHADHVGGLATFRAALGLPIWGHPKLGDRLGLTLDRALSEGETLVLDGPTPTAWDVLFTPGHAADHLCLHERSLGALVLGDMVASVGTILIAPGDGDMADYVRQLGRLAQLEANVAFPAHGDPIAHPSRLLRAYVAHRAMREEGIRRAAVASPGTLDALLPKAYVDTNPALFPLARLSLEAHLEKLVNEGALSLAGGIYGPPT